MRSNLDQSSPAIVLLSDGLQTPGRVNTVINVFNQSNIPPDGLAVDWISNKIYFTDRGLKIIGVFDPVRFHYKVLLRNNASSEPRAIVLDPNNRQVNQ